VLLTEKVAAVCSLLRRKYRMSLDLSSSPRDLLRSSLRGRDPYARRRHARGLSDQRSISEETLTAVAFEILGGVPVLLWDWWPQSPPYVVLHHLHDGYCGGQPLPAFFGRPRREGGTRAPQRDHYDGASEPPLPACMHTPRTCAGGGHTGHQHTRSQPLRISTMHLANLPKLIP